MGTDSEYQKWQASFNAIESATWKREHVQG